jgi:hypothetical protein
MSASGLFPSGIQLKIVYAIHICPMHATFSAHSNLLDLITTVQYYAVKSANYGDHQYAAYSSLQ